MVLDTLDRRGDGYRYYYSSSLDKHYDCHCYYPYKRSDRGYLPNDFKKENPPNFDGEIKKSQNA